MQERDYNQIRADFSALAQRLIQKHGDKLRVTGLFQRETRAGTLLSVTLDGVQITIWPPKPGKQDFGFSLSLDNYQRPAAPSGSPFAAMTGQAAAQAADALASYQPAAQPMAQAPAQPVAQAHAQPVAQVPTQAAIPAAAAVQVIDDDLPF